MKIKNMDYLETNELLNGVEKSKEYKQIEEDIKGVLEEQWSDLVYSGVVIILLNNLFRGDNIELPKTKKGINLLKVVIIQNAKKLLKDMNYYDDVKVKLKEYLTFTSNEGGQYELDIFLGVAVANFKLTNTFYKKKISERVTSLTNGMDTYTIKRFADEMVKAMGKAKTKQQVIDELNKAGKKIAVIRSTRTIKTETASSLEYMRVQLAMLNGIQKKKWKVILDERSCPVCRPLHNQVANIGEGFPAGYYSPPIHNSCRCTLEFPWVLQDITKSYEFYSKGVPGFIIMPQPNKNYIWVGGNSYKGKDSKPIIKYYNKLIAYSSDDIRDYFRNENENNYLYLKMGGIIEEARTYLTTDGFYQLMFSLTNRDGQLGRNFLIPKK